MRCFLIAVLPSLLCMGCQTTQLHSARPQVALAETGFDDVWQASKNVLMERGFRLDRTDERAGIMSTDPLGSQQFFEFWRSDVVTARDLWEASLCSIRRLVEVNVVAGPADVGCRVAVTVTKQRFSAPERQVTNSAAAAFFLSDSLPALTATTDATWVDWERDRALERIIAVAIVERAGRALAYSPGS